MSTLTISQMWAQLVEFDNSIRIVYDKNTRKTIVENDNFTFSIADHVDQAIFDAWTILISEED